MRFARLEDFTKGWFAGDFSPTLLSTRAVEAAVKHYRAGDVEAAHYHKIATEITVIVSGRAEMCGRELSPGDIVLLEPGEATGFHALTDTVTAVLKLPCTPGDKYPVGS
jgi:quercetin dioxygenase-like cupin family protein